METISDKHTFLTKHPVYQSFEDLDSIRHFMGYHVFAVWDFMSLLKSLQRHLTCVELPWKPSKYPAEMVRLINQIVVGEESDLGPDGRPTSHFDLYLKGMEEIGADTRPIRKFLETGDESLIPDVARDFVRFNLNVAQNGHVVEVAANFFYGREKLIPDMFQTIVETLKRENVSAPTFIYYLERHIEVDSGEHGPLASKALAYLTNGGPQLEEMALNAGLKALAKRKDLWDKVLATLPQTQEENSPVQSSLQSLSLA
jgi:hypothetical protein